jgi:hypothetical protein
MPIKNVDRLNLFREDAAGHVSTLEQLQQQYGIDPAGTNFYFGINDLNLQNFNATGTALNPTDQDFFDKLQASLAASADAEKTLQLGVEPPETSNPYAFVTANLDMVRQLAADLAGEQGKARANGKTLSIAVRYASEMNDGGQSQGNDPVGYKTTFAQVRQAFAENAPSIPLSFAPALRADLPEALIGQYWPGDDLVDIIGGTWYVGSPAQRAASFGNMRAYFLHRTGAGKPFALSEMGGCETNAAGQGTNNDAVLEQMVGELEALQSQGVSFTYVTIFLASKWGADATLRFLRS